MTQRKSMLRGIAKLLFVAPLVITVPVFLVVRNNAPDLNHGSIGDGFRKLNMALSVWLPIALGCWAIALTITAVVDLPSIPRTRMWGWLAVFVAIALLTLALVVLD